MTRASDRFIRELFNDIPSGSFALVWQIDKGKKVSYWFESAEEAEAFAKGKTDIYIGVGLSPQNFGEHKRCAASEIAAISSVWVDLDFGRDGHKRNDLPPDEASALDLLKSLPLQPTVIVNSGYGLQAWWLFKELLQLESTEDREKATSLVARWQQFIRDKAREKGWGLDATHDLSRVLRIPGTKNGKNKASKEVKIIHSNYSMRYEPSDIEDAIPLHTVDPSKASAVKLSGANQSRIDKLLIRPDVGPNPRKWAALCGADERVLPSFERKRKDLTDKSASGHDMALASFAVQADWSDQEIVDLLVSCAVKHKTEVKPISYYARTITTARNSLARVRAHEAIETMVVTGSADGVSPEDEAGNRRAQLENLSATFGIPISRIIKFRTDPPQYRLETAAGAINLGGVEGLIEQRALRNAIAAATGILISPQTRAQWHNTAQILLRACELVDAGSEATDAGMVQAWLGVFVQQQHFTNDLEEASRGRIPFIKDNKYYLFAPEFITWIKVNYRERITSRQLGILLRSFGATPVNVRLRHDVVSVWQLPHSFGEECKEEGER